MLGRLIDQYCKENNIRDFKLDPQVWTKENFSDGLKLGGKVAFVHNFNAILALTTPAPTDLEKALFYLKSQNQNINYKQICSFSDVAGGLIQVSSKHISIHHTFLKFIEHSTPMYGTLYTGHFDILLLTPTK